MKIETIRKDPTIGLGDIVTHRSTGGLYLVTKLNDVTFPIMILNLKDSTKHSKHPSLLQVSDDYKLVAKAEDVELKIICRYEEEGR